jgi:Fe-S cluster assembly ATP-binding protein
MIEGQLPMAILELDHVSLSLNGARLLKDITITFHEGRTYAVVGPNGAGKSTLAATIMGLSGYRDFTGDIRFEGESLKGSGLEGRARRGITLAWQEPARFEGLTVRKFLKAGTKYPSFEEALTQVGLSSEAYLDRAVDKTLSGGERKRIELASILAMRPKFVLLDEPDSGIDIASIEKIFDAVKLLKSYGATVVLITHSLTVLRQAEYAFLLCCGKIVDQGTAEEVAYYFENNCIPCDHKDGECKNE